MTTWQAKKSAWACHPSVRISSAGGQEGALRLRNSRTGCDQLDAVAAPVASLRGQSKDKLTEAA